MHGRSDHRGKGRFNSQEVDGWRKKSPIADSPSVTSATHSESSVFQMQDQALKEAGEKSGSYLQGTDEEESMPPMSDPNDSQAQVIYFYIVRLLVLQIRKFSYDNLLTYSISVLR